MAEIKNKGSMPSIDEKGHQITGKVAILYGTVKAISPDGTVRLLKINSPVFADDRIITGDDGSVSIVFDTFPPTQLDLGRVSNVVIDEDVYGAVSPDVVAEASAEQKSIQEALLAGDQPIELDATAAGVEQNAGGGHPIFVVNPDWVHVTPESGAETRGISWGLPSTEKYIAAQEDNSPPTITVYTGNDDGNGGSGDGSGGGAPGNVIGSNDVVYESGLSTGSNATANTEFAAGSFIISDPDGLDDIQSVTINGTEIAINNLSGTVITGTNGQLTITDYNSSTGVGTYTYELTTPTTDAPGVETDVFTLTTSDGKSTSGEAKITIEINDDVPHAIADTNSIMEDASEAITGNVLTNDQSGADTPATFVNWNSTNAVYGTFTDTGNGTYSYTLNNASTVVQGLDDGETLVETFSYTMRDADGDTDTATLTITINGTNDNPIITIYTGNDGGDGGSGGGDGGNGDGGDPGDGSTGNVIGSNDIVYESGLATGSQAAANTEFAYGTFKLSDPDGLDDIRSVTVNGTEIAIGNLGNNNIINSSIGTLTITGYDSITGTGSYQYELKNSITDLAGTETDVFTLTVSDGTAVSAPAAITIEIADDVPHAIADTNSIAEDTTTAITGNVLANDQSGADTPATFVNWNSTNAVYGSFTDTGNGTYSYTLNNANAAVQALTEGQTVKESFTYSMKDADGDISSSNLTITITGTNDTPRITNDPGNIEGGNDVVYESGLPVIGSDAAADTEFAHGTFKLFDADGLDDIASVTINGQVIPIDDLVGTVIHGSKLTITAYDPSTGVASYQYELKSPITDVPDVPETENYILTTTDKSGATSAPSTITIEIIDDVPTVKINFTQSGSVGSDESTDIGKTITASGAVLNIDKVIGADQVGATTDVSLDITTADSGLTTTDGHPITLIAGATNNDVLGKYDSNGDGILDASAFKVTISETGVLSVTQYESIRHPDATNPNDSLDLTGKIDAVVTVIDGDGDVATDQLAIGQLVSFTDDGPSISLSASGETGVLLTTQDADTVGAASDTAVSTANFSNVFAVGSSSYGADGAGSQNISYSLDLLGPSGSDSGLNSHGADILLTKNASGEIEGKAGSTVVFKLSVASDGVVTLTQNEVIDHAVGSDLSSLANGLVKLTGTATITDYDGDTATDSKYIDLGGNIQFADIGPSISLSASGETGVLLTTQDADTVGAASDTAVSTANFSNVFAVGSSSYGADGAGSQNISYSLDLLGPSGSDSGLNSHGADILLTKNASGEIEGKAGSTVVFKLSVASDGVVTLTQNEVIDHAVGSDLSSLANGLVKLTGTATITDYDGDTATDSKYIDLGGNIQFADIGPSISLSASGETGVLLTTQDADTVGAASDTAVSTANFSNVFAVGSSSYGADGAGSQNISYSLDLLGPSGSDSGLNSHGADILLTKNASGEIEGKAGSTVVFKLSVASDGVVTLTQNEVIDHAVGSDLSSLANGLVKLTGTATITDYDGDTATDSKYIDLGGNIQFADIGPSISLSASGETGVLLTTQDADTVGAASDTAVSTANFSNVFAVGSSSYGADGAGSQNISYSLDLLGPSGSDSGLNSHGADILLTKNASGEIEGKAGSTVVFKLSVASDGVVTLTQNEVIDHAVGSDLSSLANGLVKLTGTATITDYDGDTATDSKYIDLGGNIQFADIGPSISLSASGETGVLLTTQDADTVGAASDTAVSTANFSNVFAVGSSSYGADGAGSQNISYSLDLLGPSGSDSGLNSHGADILLTKNASGEIEGKAGSTVVFKLSVASDGVVTLTQNEVIDHAVGSDLSSLANGLVKLTGTATITDYDGDTATDSKYIDLGGNIQFADIGPSISLSASGETGVLLTTQDADTVGAASDTAVSTANFSNVFAVGSSSYGADGAGSQNISYSLDLLGPSGSDSGLNSHGADILLTKNASGEIEGKAGSTVVFKLSVASDGVVTLTQNEVIDHAVGSDLSSLANGLVKLTGTATITDYDGDTATDSKYIDLGGNIQFADIGPSISLSASGETGVLLTTQDADTVGAASDTAVSTANFSNVFAVGSSSYGADGAGSQNISYSLDLLGPSGSDSGLNSHGADILLTKNASGEIEGKAGSTVVFKLSVASDGVVTLTQNEVIDHAVGSDLSSLANGLVKLTGTATITDYDGDTATDSKYIDLGGNIQFADIGPSISLSASGETGVLLTTQDADTVGAASDTAVSTANFSNVFAVGSSSYGADGAGSQNISYSLDLLGPSGSDSGLNSHGADILLTKNASGEIEGKAGSTVVFKLSVASDGVVTLTQNEVIDHAVGSDLSSLANGLVKLTGTATITDYDGDTATDSKYIDLGGNIQFADIGPSISLSASGETGVLLTTQDADTVGAASDTAVSTANFSNVFAVGSSSYGADGAGSQNISYSLDLLGPSGSDSGLNSHGADILLTKNASGEIEGKAGSTVVFKLSVASDGVVTLTQNEVIDHAVGSDLSSLANGLVKLTGTATITDYDGDTATDSKYIDLGGNIQFADIGPSISLSASGETGVLLTTQDADTVGAASDTAVSTANFSNVFAVGSSSYGADGAGSQNISYSLDLLGPSGSDSGLNSHGADILLTKNASGEIEGKAGSTVVFKLSVASDGVVTLTQNEVIDHAVGSDLSSLANGLVKLTGTATITDYDGDTATDSKYIDLGGNIQFADIGPSISLSASGETGVLLTTQDADTVGAASDTAVSTANFSNVFAVGSSSYGADGAGSQNISYSLDLLGPSGSDSGLNSHGADILLTKNASGEIEGKAGSTVVFKLSVASDGVVTLTQNEVIDHAVGSDLSSLANGLVKLTGTATITDYDGDTATDSKYIDLGGNIQFADIGPSISLSASGETGVLLTTQDADTVGAASDTAVSTANFSNVFAVGSSSYGADGAGSQNISYSLDLLGPSGSDSGLNSHGADILLTKNASGEIEGKAGSTVVFKLSVASDGVVTLTQNEVIDHAVGSDLSSLANGLVKLTGTATITDYDGDTATDSKYIDLGGNIQFADIGPSISLSASGETGVLLTTQDADTVGAASDTAVSTANFSNVFAVGSSSYGADGAGSQNISYSLDLLGPSGSDSGLNSHGADILLTKNASGEIEGKAGSTVVFKLSVASDGVVTLTQNEVIDHAVGSDLSSLANGLVKLTGTATITDYDGDTATDSKYIDLGGNIQFADIGPSISLSASGETGVLLTTQDADTVGAASDTAVSTANFSNVFAVGSSSYGADGAGSQNISYSLDLLGPSGSDSGLNSHGADILLTKNASGEIEGKAGSTVVFKLSVASDGVVTLTQNEVIDHAVGSDLSSLANGLVKLTGTATITDYDGDTATDSKYIDLGGNIQFADIGPSISLSASGETGVLLTTQDADTVGAASDTAVSTANFSNVFAVGSSSYGADGAGSQNISYSLDLLGPSGSDSGLNSHGADILLTKNASGEIEGKAGSTVVFKLSVASDGVVTLTQNEVIDHAVGSDLSSLANGLVKLTGTATITDYDGDTATDSKYIDLGGNIQFADIGPSISLSASGETGVLLTTQDADTVGAASDTAVSTANFSNVFAVGSSSYGADGAGSQNISYSLDLLGPSGSDSGLNSHGADILLTKNASGEIEGKAGSTVVFKLSVASDGVVTLTQNEVIDHAVGSDLSSLANGLVKLTGTATITDYDGDTATDSKYIDLGGNIQFADIGPTAYADINSVAEGAVITGNVLTDGTDDVFGADGAATTMPAGGVVGVKAGSDTTTPVTSGVGTVINGAYGKLTLNTDGSYTYDGNPDAITTPQSDIFVYTIQDADGDFSTTTLTIHLTDGGLVAPADNDALVYEKALDTAQNGSDLAASTYTGSIPDDAGETDAVNLLNASGGVGPYTYSLVGSATGDYGAIQINPDGSYIYTLTKPYDTTPDADNGMNTEDNRENFSYKVTDANGNTATGTITVDIVDDIPTAGDQNVTVGPSTSVGTNLLITLDISGSMDDSSGVDGKTRLDLAKDALNELISEYEGHGPVMIRLITFSSTATIVGDHWMTAAEANAAINSFTANGYTNYDDALIKAMDAFDDTGKISGVQNISYFLSDGQPNRPESDPGIQSGEQTDWETFLENGDITSFVLGMGTGVTSSNLAPIAYDGLHEVQIDPIVVTDMSQLEDVLLDTVIIPSTLEGNLIEGSVPATFGADGPAALKIVSIAHDANGDGIDEVYNTASAGYNDGTTTLTIATEAGGTFVVNFSTGAYTYIGPAGSTLLAGDVFKYTIMDADGDTASATLTVNLPTDGILVVGTNADDISNQTIDHYIDDAAPYAGAITGSGGNDVLVGDLNATSIAGKTLNLSLILDTSGSMDDGYTFNHNDEIMFNGVTMTRLAALKQAVINTLNDLANGPAENVRVQIVDFDTTATQKGIYDLKIPGELTAAIAAVNSLQGGGATNYEAALHTALTWANSTGADAPLTGTNVVSQAIFVSDGEPTKYYIGNDYSDLGGDGSNFAPENINQILGTGTEFPYDTFSEVSALEAKGFTIEAVGINVSATNLDHLNQVEGEAAGSNPDVATNITTGEQLNSVLVDLTSTVVSNAGDDNIVGGDGDDVIFGDTINYNYTGTESEMMAYIKANHSTLATESGLTGGNDTINAGAGNDIVYGQEGNDTIDGGEGNDLLSGGTGNNVLSGGTGADTFVLSNGGSDTIQDYNKGQLDKVDISAVLDVADETVAKSYMEFHNNGDGKAVLEVYNSNTDHSTGHLVGSVTFDNITDATNLDSLLGKVDVDHDA